MFNFRVHVHLPKRVWSFSLRAKSFAHAVNRVDELTDGMGAMGIEIY